MSCRSSTTMQLKLLPLSHIRSFPTSLSLFYSVILADVGLYNTSSYQYHLLCDNNYGFHRARSHLVALRSWKPALAW